MWGGKTNGSFEFRAKTEPKSTRKSSGVGFSVLTNVPLGYSLPASYPDIALPENSPEHWKISHADIPALFPRKLENRGISRSLRC